MFTTILNFDYTNNVAEYEACVLGLHMTIDQKIKVLNVYGDFPLVIYQFREEFEIQDSKLILY